MGQHHLTEQRFSSMELDERLLDALKRIDFHYCTPIQAKSLPLLLANQDVAGQAQTGTGKTLAFLLACAQRLLGSVDRNSRMASLVVPPLPVTAEAPTATGNVDDIAGVSCCTAGGGSRQEHASSAARAGKMPAPSARRGSGGSTSNVTSRRRLDGEDSSEGV